MKDIKDSISAVIRTGKVVIGSKKVITALLSSNLNLIILSNNCPKELREGVVYYSKLSNTPHHITESNSLEFGSICGKPFPVSALGISEQGDSNILEIVDNK